MSQEKAFFTNFFLSHKITFSVRKCFHQKTFFFVLQKKTYKNTISTKKNYFHRTKISHKKKISRENNMPKKNSLKKLVCPKKTLFLTKKNCIHQKTFFLLKNLFTQNIVQSLHAKRHFFHKKKLYSPEDFFLLKNLFTQNIVQYLHTENHTTSSHKKITQSLKKKTLQESQNAALRTSHQL